MFRARLRIRLALATLQASQAPRPMLVLTFLLLAWNALLLSASLLPLVRLVAEKADMQFYPSRWLALPFTLLSAITITGVAAVWALPRLGSKARAAAPLGVLFSLALGMSLGAIAGWASPGPVHSWCSCKWVPPPLAAAAQADAVFVGRITRQTLEATPGDNAFMSWVKWSFGFRPSLGRHAYDLQFSVETPIKGPAAGATVTLSTGAGCVPPPRTGQELLVYAHRIPGTDNWFTQFRGDCGRTAAVGTVREELSLLLSARDQL